MAHPDFTVLLARQRTGTNALRSVLDTHPDIHCFGEIFKFEEKTSADPLTRAGNYFTFLEQYCAADITRAFPDRHEQIFADYRAYLTGLTAKRLTLVDVKYNSTHHISAVWRAIADPTLFTLIKTSGVAVLHLTRRNLLRCVLSHLKGRASNTFHAPVGTPPPQDTGVTVPPIWLKHQLQRWADEDRQVAWTFREHPHYKHVEYTDLFPDASGAMAGPALVDLAAWFGLENVFVNRAGLQKQSSLPLDQTITNFEEVRDVLRGTPFEFCLQDEPAYRQTTA